MNMFTCQDYDYPFPWPARITRCEAMFFHYLEAGENVAHYDYTRDDSIMWINF